MALNITVIVIIFLVLLIGLIVYFFNSIKTKVIHILNEIDVELHPSKEKDKDGKIINPTVRDTINNIKVITANVNDLLNTHLVDLKPGTDPNNPTLYDRIKILVGETSIITTKVREGIEGIEQTGEKFSTRIDKDWKEISSIIRESNEVIKEVNKNKTKVTKILGFITSQMKAGKPNRPTVRDEVVKAWKDITTLKEELMLAVEYLKQQLTTNGTVEEPTIRDELLNKWNDINEIIPQAKDTLEQGYTTLRDVNDKLIPQADEAMFKGNVLLKATQGAGFTTGFFPNADKIEKEMRKEWEAERKKQKEEALKKIQEEKEQKKQIQEAKKKQPVLSLGKEEDEYNMISDVFSNDPSLLIRKQLGINN